MPDDAIASLQGEQREFARARDWERYHTPQNLAALIASEAGELLALFRWGEDAVGQKPEEVRAELADVFLGILRLADVAGVDLVAAAKEKLRRNAVKYPEGHTGPERPPLVATAARSTRKGAAGDARFTGDIFGIDFSGARNAGKVIWIANGRIEDGRLSLERCVRMSELEGSGRDRDRALEALRRVIRLHPYGVFGLDFPFSLPRELIDDDWETFVSTLSERHPTAEHFKAGCFVRAGRELKRATDIESKTPFSAYNLRLFQQTYYGIRDVLAPLVAGDEARVVPMQEPAEGKATLIEVCPASTLKKETLYESYKGTGEVHRNARRVLIAALEQRGELAPVRDDLLETLVEDAGGDAIDAVIGAVAASRFVQQSARPGLMEVHRIEGFVYT